MIKRFYEVSFPMAMPRESLTYHLDQEPDDPPLPKGCRVVASIQRRQVIGYVVGASENPPDFKTVAISQVIDFWPLLSPGMVELGTWIARTCMCSPGEAFNAMLPSGIKSRIVRNIRANENARGKKMRGEDLPNAVLWLLDSGVAPLSKFLQTFPKFTGRMASLLSEGLVEIVHDRVEDAKPRINRLLTTAPDREIKINELTPKERQVIEYLFKVNSPVSASQIRKGASVSAGPIDQLLKKGILVVTMEREFREVATESFYFSEPPPVPILTSEQENALSFVRNAAETDRKPVLIRGVTCSGKTEIYLRWVSEQTVNGKSVIVLVPEISLTPQMTKRFRDRFGRNVAILHSRLSDGERFDQWELIRRGECRVIVGARSAVFAPVKNLGTIIIDEEGEPSFKQAETPRYHAREVAAKRCEIEGGILIMGSATPTLDAYQKGRTGEYHLVEMHNRVTDRNHPKVQVVDMRQELVAKNNRSIFSSALSKAVATTVAGGKQAILYLNRRGHSSFVFCRACGKAVECSRCGISLVYHSGSNVLRCHYCGEAKSQPGECPSCGSTAIKFFGAGTQRIEAESRRYFPHARIQRLDSDTVATSGSLEEILDKFGKGEIDILIGTQMVAKGLDFPNVTLVGIMAADGLLRLPDFRASERNFSLLTQVAGRSGRGDQAGNVILQTYFPEHFSIRHALSENYPGFFNEEIKHREEADFPPFCNIAMILIASEKIEKVKETATRIGDRLRKEKCFSECRILGPSPAPIERINNMYRYQILIKFGELESIIDSLRETMQTFQSSGVRLTVDFNPYFCM